MTFKELQAQISNTGKGKLPTYKQLSQSNMTALIKESTKDHKLTVYKEGYVSYYQIRNGKKYVTVFAIDRMKWTYKFATGEFTVINESEYESLDAINILTLYAEERLIHNANSREEYRIDYHLNNDGNDYTAESTIPDFTNKIIDQLEQRIASKRLYKAISRLTEKQQKVIVMYYFNKMTQQQIAEKLGISRTSVADCLHGALKKMKKFF